MRVKDIVLISVVGILTSATLFGVGFITSDGRTLTDVEKLNFQLAALAGTWFGGLGTFIAVAVALYIASGQARDAEKLIIHQHKMDKNDSAIGALYHALAIVDDLRGRLTLLQNKYCTIGSYPLAGYTITMDGILTRYETLFDRELYRYLPGPIVDQIKEMSGSITGLNIMVTLIATQYQNNPNAHVVVPAAREPKPFEDLFSDLDDLYTAIEQLANNEQLLKRELQRT